MAPSGLYARLCHAFLVIIIIITICTRLLYSCESSNNPVILATLKILMMMMMMITLPTHRLAWVMMEWEEKRGWSSVFSYDN